MTNRTNVEEKGIMNVPSSFERELQDLTKVS